MENTDIQAYQYQFSGYNLPMIQLDETGPQYILIPKPHPYYIDQSFEWTKPAYYATEGNITNPDDFLSKSLYPMTDFEQDIV